MKSSSVTFLGPWMLSSFSSGVEVSKLTSRNPIEVEALALRTTSRLEMAKELLAPGDDLPHLTLFALDNCSIGLGVEVTKFPLYLLKKDFRRHDHGHLVDCLVLRGREQFLNKLLDLILA